MPARCVIGRPRQGLGSQTQVGTGAQPGPRDSSYEGGRHARVPRRLQDEQLRLQEKRVLACAGVERRHERASSVRPVVVRAAKADQPHLGIAAACDSAVWAAARSRSSRCHELLVLMLLHPQCSGSRGSRYHGDEMHRETPARLPEVQRLGATEWIVELGAKWVEDKVAFVEDADGACARDISAPKHSQHRTNAIRGSRRGATLRRFPTRQSCAESNRSSRAADTALGSPGQGLQFDTQPRFDVQQICIG